MPRTRPYDDDDDDRPLRRSRPRDDDDDDDEPIASRRRPDHDDEDDLPRRRRGSRDAEEGNGALLAILIGGGALVLFFIGGLVAYFALRNGSDSTASTSPSDSSTADASTPRPDFGGEWPQFPGMPPNTVILRIVGVPDHSTEEALGDRIDAIAPTGNRRMQFIGWRPRMSYAIAPIANAEEFAKKINFGRVVSIEGNVIKIVADKLEGPPTEPIGRALYYVKSKDPGKRQVSLMALSNDIPEDRQADVLRALEPLLNATGNERNQVAEIYCKWATTAETPMIIRLLKGEKDNTAASQSAMKALARLKDPRGIGPIIARLDNFFGRHETKEALIAYGPVAEPEVLKLLANPNKEMRSTACEVLGKIGTAKSVAALEQAAQDSELGVRAAAKRAIEALRKPR